MHTDTLRRRTTVALATAALTSALLAGSAHAAPLDATCVGTDTTTYTPGLTNTPGAWPSPARSA
ncbi:hypothetical protein GCM10009759_66040 [Kitasatospora saccharophila]|uniref:Uncharacterized protein n=1 Tax=Kitasatospora saccharophila TaxID=407973 RepID=A0ABP5JIT6_9ACTN